MQEPNHIFQEFCNGEIWEIGYATSVAEDWIRYDCHIAHRGEHPQKNEACSEIKKWQQAAGNVNIMSSELACSLQFNATTDWGARRLPSASPPGLPHTKSQEQETIKSKTCNILMHPRTKYSRRHTTHAEDAHPGGRSLPRFHT